MQDEYVLKNTGSERCKACDAKFRTVYRRDIGQWEDLCNKCKPIALDSLITDNPLTDPLDYLEEGQMADAIEAEAYSRYWGDLNNDDDYYNSGDMGGYNYFDRYE